MEEKVMPQVFKHEEFGEVRVVMIDGEPWFVGKDVTTALGYSNPRDALRKHVDDEDKRESQIATPYGVQNMTVINESGLYALVFGSQLESAKKFKRWVTHEILPSIRKTGSYSVASVNPLAIAKSMTALTDAISDLSATNNKSMTALANAISKLATANTGFTALTDAISDLTAAERENLESMNSEDTMMLAKVQLLIDLAATTEDKRIRSKLVRAASNLVMGDDFFK